MQLSLGAVSAFQDNLDGSEKEGRGGGYGGTYTWEGGKGGGTLNLGIVSGNGGLCGGGS